MECWLRPNYRVVLLGMVLPTSLLVVGLVVASGTLSTSHSVRIVGWGLAGAACCLLAVLLWNARLPRLAYWDGHLLVYLGATQPIRVPVQYVECFFLGRAPSTLKDRAGGDIESQTVVVRLAQSAGQWDRRDVKTTLGSWCDSYITIRGMWCEPLSIQRVNELNRRLAEVHRQLQSESGV